MFVRPSHFYYIKTLDVRFKKRTSSNYFFMSENYFLKYDYAEEESSYVHQ